MTLLDASRESGFSLSSLYRKIKEGKFLACQPRGRKGGWEINASSFRQWIQKNRAATSNR
jgi:predicted DNA-binding transcriptional regulator AlpA